ncbi:hypothetical protein PINS_up006381 [Pythium insidiosum]|nr:hypothetical protein PINS_up006381 [Pythium insidiosum]
MSPSIIDPMLSQPQATVAPCYGDAVQLEPLRPRPVLPPAGASPPSPALGSLKALRRVDVSASDTAADRKSLYRIKLHRHLQREGRIPVVRIDCGRPNSTCDAPDAQADVDYKAFVQLRDDLYHIARTSHIYQPCGFCGRVLEYVANGRAKPRRTSTLFASRAEVSSMLQRFLQDLLAIVGATETNTRDASCSGRARIANLLCRFLGDGV